jgi:hypothetical protein
VYSNGHWTDVISEFLEITEGSLSPAIFRKWAGIAMVAGALERRVWISTPRGGAAFANLYTLLVAPPGAGKFVVERIRELWTNTRGAGNGAPAFHVAPDSVTKASLIDTLAKAKAISLQAKPPQTYHSLLVASEEFSLLLPAYDMEFIGVLNSIYNNKSLHEEARRFGPAREVRIENPQLNIFAAAQPGWLASVFPEEAWSTGLTSRMIMIYAPDVPLVDLFDTTYGDTREREAELSLKLGHLAELWGEAIWGAGAAEKFGAWHLAGGQPAPTHSRLAHYVRRRSLHVLKLMLVSAVSRSGHPRIELADVDRAIGWLREAEDLMPDVFRAMLGKSDSTVVEELHFYATVVWNKNGREPLASKIIYGFLAQRVTSDKIEKIIDIADRSGILMRLAGSDTFLPKPKHEWGVPSP